MAKAYRAYLPEQDLLLPPSLRDWLPENHLAHFVSDVVDQLDLSAIESVYEKEERGQPPYHPRMMTKILLYGYCVGVFSSRQMQKKLVEDVGFRMLAAGNEPDFRTISDFRKLHLAALQGLFDQMLQIALQAGTMKLGRVVLDGSKVKANASKHKAMSYGRMQEDEKRLRAEVKRLLEQAEKVDGEEDARYGQDQSGDELPAELARRETRLEKIREAQRALEERAREQAKNKGEPEAEAKPEAKMQYNFTDPESRIMKGADGFVQAYNAQVAVEPDFQLIVGQLVTQEANDKQQMKPVVEVIQEQSGQKPGEVVSDSGYCSDANGLSGEEKDRRVRSRGSRIVSGSREALPARAAAEGSYACGPHAAKPADQKGRGHLLDTQDRGRTGVWTNQRGARLSTLSLAWTEEGTRGVGDRLSHAQHSEVTSALLWIEEEDKQARKLYT